MRPHHTAVVRALVVTCALLATACGTRSVEVADASDPEASGPVAVVTTAPAPASSTTSTAPAPAPSSVPSSTVPAPSTTLAPVPTALELADDGVPVNGQTSGVVRTTTGWVFPVVGDLADGWRVWTPCGRLADITTGEFVGTVDFVLDPGHGGPETGAVGPGGTREADLNLDVSRRIAAALEADGYSVVMTRDDDVRVPIVTRAEIALALDPIAFISIHHNGGTDAVSAEPGTEMYFQLASPESKRLAGLLYEETRALLDPLGSTWFALSDAGAMGRPDADGADYYGVLRRPAGVTSVLTEFAYITNPVEEELLNRADVRDGLAEAVRTAVQRFTSSTDPGSGFTEEPMFRGFAPSGAGRTTNCTDPALE